MRRILDVFSWWFLGVFAFPTFLIMGSWNSLPGDVMYPVKIGLEKILLFVAKPSYVAEASLNVKYTERRLSETKVLLSNDKSGKGLAYLSQQIVATRELIARAPNPEVKRQLTQQYIQTLKQASSDLSEQRQKIANTIPTDTGTKNTAYAPGTGTQNSAPAVNANSPNVFVPPNPTVVVHTQTTTVNSSEEVPPPTSAPAFVNPTPEPSDVANTQTVVNQIDDTQTQIQNSIDELTQDSIDQGDGSSDNNDKGKDKGKDKGSDNNDYKGEGDNKGKGSDNNGFGGSDNH